LLGLKGKSANDTRRSAKDVRGTEVGVDSQHKESQISWCPGKKLLYRADVLYTADRFNFHDNHYYAVYTSHFLHSDSKKILAKEHKICKCLLKAMSGTVKGNSTNFLYFLMRFGIQLLIF